MAKKPKVYVRAAASNKGSGSTQKKSSLYVLDDSSDSTTPKKRVFVKPSLDYSPDSYTTVKTSKNTFSGKSSYKKRSRVRVLDVLRGIAIISMVLFHLAYDLKYIYGRDLAWFAPPLQDIWRASISWSFLALAGITSTLSRNNFYRAERYLAVALGVFAATSFMRVDTPINFGIIFCMGATTLLYAILEKLHLEPRGVLAALVLAVLFVASLRVDQGYFGIGNYFIELPQSLYETPYLSWLGFPGPGFSSGDYYPLIPYSFAYLSFAAFAKSKAGKAALNAGRSWGFRPLEFIGRHPLIIYVLHQPLILLLLHYL